MIGTQTTSCLAVSHTSRPKAVQGSSVKATGQRRDNKGTRHVYVSLTSTTKAAVIEKEEGDREGGTGEPFLPTRYIG